KGRLAAPAWSDNAENLLMADVERELAECHDGAVQEQLARQLHTDRNLGIRLRNRHAAVVLHFAVSRSLQHSRRADFLGSDAPHEIYRGGTTPPTRGAGIYRTTIGRARSRAAHLRRRITPDGGSKGAGESLCRISFASRMISRQDNSST